MIKFLSGNTELTDCTDINPFYPESMPDFQSKKRTPEKIENDPKATPPASSKMPKEDNPPFFVYLTRPQKLDYHNDRIELNIRKALYMFTDPRKPVIFLNLINELKVLQFNHENSHNP